jgi:hypothetical protein
MFASTFNSIKSAFVTKPFTPNAYQANPSQIVNELEDAFKAMFEIAPDLSKLKTITPRQAYAGGENVFTYAAKRSYVHIGIAFDELREELRTATISGAVIIMSLPRTVSDEFANVVMGFAIPLNYAYYTTKHLSFDAGKFAANVTVQLHGTKIAIKKRARHTSSELDLVLHTKQVVLSTGNVLTAQLDNHGCVSLYVAQGNTDETTVTWYDDLRSVKVTKLLKMDEVKGYKWNEDEFNTVFVKLVAQHAPQFTEELAAAALGAKPMTKTSVVSEFAAHAKEAKTTVKAETKAAAKEQAPAAPAPAVPVQPEAPVAKEAAAPAEVKTAVEESLAHAYPEGTVFTQTKNISSEQQGDFEGDTISGAAAGVELGREPNLPTMNVGEDGATVVDMGEVAGIPMRQNKPCNDRNAEKVLKKVIANKAKHVTEETAASQLPSKTIAYYDPTRTLSVIGKVTSYSIVCDLESDVRPIFKLMHHDLKALGVLLDYDFGRATTEYCICSNLLMTRLLGNGNTLLPLVFDEK